MENYYEIKYQLTPRSRISGKKKIFNGQKKSEMKLNGKQDFVKVVSRNVISNPKKISNEILSILPFFPLVIAIFCTKFRYKTKNSRISMETIANKCYFYLFVLNTLKRKIKI